MGAKDVSGCQNINYTGFAISLRDKPFMLILVGYNRIVEMIDIQLQRSVL